MKSSVRHKLGKIDELYPPARIAASKERWRRLWAGEAPLDRIPFQAGPVPGCEYYAAGLTPEATLDKLLDSLILHGVADDDLVPTLFPGCHQGTIPSTFGAKEVVLDGDYSCERLLGSVGDICSLPPACLRSGTPAQAWLDMQRCFVDDTEGRMPVHVTDMQGPFDVAGQLLGYDNLMLAAYDDFESYHTLMTKTTEAFVYYWQEQERLLGDLFVGTHLWGWSWVPRGCGATVSVDSLVMFSPGFFDTYVKPYLERIGESLGGIVTHSCGNFAGVIPSLRGTHGLRAVNASQMTLRQMLDAGLSSKTLLILQDDYQSLKNTAALMAQRRQPVELTIGGVFPDKNTGFWSHDQHAEIRGKVEHVKVIMEEAAASFA
jgi:hypothetical protein